MSGATASLILEGHIIDSMTLPQVMDLVMDLNGHFTFEELRVGRQNEEPSFCRLQVSAADPIALDHIVRRARELGARVADEAPVRLEPVPRDGVFPEGFYATTNLPTFVLHGDTWLPVERQEMDCAIAVDPGAARAWCLPFSAARQGMQVVVGHSGVRAMPLERSRQKEIFGFMTSEVSAEKPKKVLISEIAADMRHVRARGGRILVVAGPAVVHTGASRHLSRLIELGYVQVLFGGNALAAHDVEAALFGTSLGINVESGLSVEYGHENHMRAINRVRQAGSLAALAESGELASGIMKAALDAGTDVVLAGSIRDDGPLPGVITDVIAAQDRMREAVGGVELALMISTMLHSIATGNLLPAEVRTVCVDINPSVVTKLADRGSWQSIGMVTDVESFLRELAADLAPAQPES